MGLPTTEQLEPFSLSILVFGPGFGESIVLRAAGDEMVTWGVIDSAKRERPRSSGSSRQMVNPSLDFLRSQNARPSLIVLTHPHQDHTCGFADLIDLADPQATVGCLEPLLVPPSPFSPVENPDDKEAVSQSQTEQALKAVRRAWETGSRSWPLVHGSKHLLGSWQISVLHPAQQELDSAVKRYRENLKVNLNDLSASLLVENEGSVLVLGADCEAVAWQAIASRMHPSTLLDTRPIKVPHHGSLAALQPVLVDPTRPDPDRPQVVTPFPSSGRLPRFDKGQGVERLIEASGAVDLTAMPVDLVADSNPVTLTSIRSSLNLEAFEGDDDLLIRSTDPAPAPGLTETTRDPYESWILVGIEPSGDVAIIRGEHALQVVA
jgi:hypothetical protein